MKVFFDTEFTGLHKNTTLLSIGLITEDNRKFYAEFCDYDKSQIDGWISKNVMPYLIRSKIKKAVDTGDSVYIPPYYIYGSKGAIAKKLEEWFKSLGEEIELISDVSHYDMVLFCDIFGSAFDIPKMVSPVCHDINQDIAEFLKVSQREAFEMSRETLAGINPNDIKVEKHNALFDAIVIKQIYEKIKGVK